MSLLDSSRSRLAAVSLTVAVAGVGGVAPVTTAGAVTPSTATPGTATSASGSDSRHVLTNLAHLNFLGDRVSPPAQARHTTYQLKTEPSIGVLWTYADALPGGGFKRVGGGTYHPDTNTYDQGAYNADDISRAAVVYLRHWKQFHDAASRRHARELLRGLTYLQTASGPNRGNVVLWMQPDGTLNRSPIIVELPDPSDSGPSFWLSRTIWALGEGYAAFRSADPDFAAFLRQREELALDALDRQVLNPEYGHYQTVDGLRWPSWLIVDGADASSEAVYGLVAYTKATGSARARRDLGRLADGIAAMPLGDAYRWPFGAIMPWAQSRSIWHGYLDQMSGSLAAAATVLHRPKYVKVAVGEVARFTPHLLVQGGPDNFWGPAPIDRTQIAYGADATVQNLLSTARATGRTAFREVAGVAAAWFFGNNPAGVRMYHPATGVTFDGINSDGEVNTNSGAESTIHGLLTMLALDAAPDVEARADVSTVRARVSWSLVEAESGTLSGRASVVTPESAYTGESQWSGGAYVELRPGGATRMSVTLPTQDRYLVMPVFDRQQVPLKAVGTRQMLGGAPAGTVYEGGAGPQGITAVPGFLDIATGRTAGMVSAGARTLTASYVGSGTPAKLDALLVQPAVEWRLLAGPEGSGTALLRSFDTRQRVQVVRVPGFGKATVHSYDTTGRLVTARVTSGAEISAPVAPGGFTTVER